MTSSESDIGPEAGMGNPVTGSIPRDLSQKNLFEEGGLRGCRCRFSLTWLRGHRGVQTDHAHSHLIPRRAGNLRTSPTPAHPTRPRPLQNGSSAGAVPCAVTGKSRLQPVLCNCLVFNIPWQVRGMAHSPAPRKASLSCFINNSFAAPLSLLVIFIIHNYLSS